MILLIEDNDAVAEVVRLHLELAGYQVTRAAEPEHGLAIVDERRPHAVVLDYRLPGMSGREWLLRARERGLDCPVVSLTAEVNAWTREDAEALGVVHLLTKPVRRQDLLAGIEAALNGRELVTV